MERYYLAIDIGASSGRHILAHMEDGKMVTEEIYRFENGMTKIDGELCWDVKRLFREIKAGMKKCSEAGKIPISVGIDTWAVDFVLLDKNDQMIGNAVAYRDDRTDGMVEQVSKVISQEELYARTGIQKQKFNTIYQLMAIREMRPEDLNRAQTFLMIPDYFHFLLTGKKAAEYTNATTTQLVSPVTKIWDNALIEQLGYPQEIFPPISLPGSELGHLTEQVREEVGFDCKVILPATHDTGSAVMAVPKAKGQVLYISSGTWSLMGTELMSADCSQESRERNFTNEGGYGYRFRYLKNIMGLWMIQSVKKEIGQNLSFEEICNQAAKETIQSQVDCNDSRFLAPENMTQEVKKACQESGQQPPEGIAQTAAVIYNSLAKCYADTVKEIEERTGYCFDSIHIVGGGSNAVYLNSLTAAATGKKVYAGPGEATAIGNITAQMIQEDVFVGLQAARECVGQSFPILVYEPDEMQ